VILPSYPSSSPPPGLLVESVFVPHNIFLCLAHLLSRSLPSLVSRWSHLSLSCLSAFGIHLCVFFNLLYVVFSPVNLRFEVTYRLILIVCFPPPGKY